MKSVKKEVKGDKLRFNDLFFQPESELLQVYSEHLVRKLQPPECTDNAQLLIEYFEGYGKLANLLRAISRHEIENTNTETQIFRGNSAFTRIYNVYTKMYMKDFVYLVTLPTLTKLIEITNEKEKSIEHIQVIEFLNTVQLFMENILSNFDNIPSHYKQIMRSICFAVGKKQNVNSTPQNTFNLLFFLRLLLPYFQVSTLVLDTLSDTDFDFSNQQIYFKVFLKFSKILQMIVTKDEAKAVLEGVQLEGEQKKELEKIIIIKGEVKLLYQTLTSSNTNYCLEESVLNYAIQDQLYDRMYVKVKEYYAVISQYLTTDKEELQNIIDGKNEDMKKENELRSIMQNCSDLFFERMSAIEKENKEITNECLNEVMSLKSLSDKLQKEKEFNEWLKKSIETLKNDGKIELYKDVEYDTPSSK